jgi:hypothetical protein
MPCINRIRGIFLLRNIVIMNHFSWHYNKSLFFLGMISLCYFLGMPVLVVTITENGRLIFKDYPRWYLRVD